MDVVELKTGAGRRQITVGLSAKVVTVGTLVAHGGVCVERRAVKVQRFCRLSWAGGWAGLVSRRRATLGSSNSNQNHRDWIDHWV